GVLKPGDEVVVLPGGLKTTIAKLETSGGPVDEAWAPMSVVAHLTDDLDVSRGDMICRPNNQPTVGQDLDAMVCWMSDKPLQPKGRYAIKHTTRWTRGVVTELLYRLNIHTLHREESVGGLGLNDIGRVKIRTTTPVIYDPYRRNRTTGSFIIV